MAPYHGGEFVERPCCEPEVKVAVELWPLALIILCIFILLGTRWGNRQMCQEHVEPTWINCTAFQPRHAEVDHLTELELGGSGKNLWPQVRN